MRILSIESSTRETSVCVGECISPLSDDPSQILSELLTDTGNDKHPIKYWVTDNTRTTGNTSTVAVTAPIGASAAMAPVIEKVLQASNTSVSDLELIAVSTGPGSFTGLRVGSVTAKTLAYTTGCPVVGIHAADALAYQALANCAERPTNAELAIGLDIGRGELLTYRYQITESGFKGSHDGAILNPKEWQKSLLPGTWVTGNGLRMIDETALSQFIIPEQRIPKAESIAALGVVEFFKNGAADYWKLEPIYSRPSAAEEARAKK